MWKGDEVVKRQRRFDQQAKRIMRLRRIAAGILNGDACQAEWARREGVSAMTISRDFEEIFEKWLTESKRSARMKQAARIKQQEAIQLEAKESFLLSKRVIFDCPNCKGEGFVENKGACIHCDGEGRIERYDTPGDPKWLSIMHDCVKECSRLEGLGNNKHLFQKKEPKKHLHLHAAVGSIDFRNASNEDVIAARSLVARLQGNGANGRSESKIVEVESVDGSPSDHDQPEGGNGEAD